MRCLATFCHLFSAGKLFCPYLPGRRIIRSGFFFFQIAISLRFKVRQAHIFPKQKKEKKRKDYLDFRILFVGFRAGWGKRENVSIFIHVPHLPSRIFRGRGRTTYVFPPPCWHTWASRRNFPRILLEIYPRSICAQDLFRLSLLRERKLLQKLQWSDFLINFFGPSDLDNIIL